MDCGEGPEFSQAEQLLPPAWYENKFVVAAATGIIGLGVVLEAGANPEFSTSLMFPLIAAGLYIAGRLLDVHSTQRCLKFLETADVVGVKHPLVENNIFLEDRPPSSEFPKWPNVIVDYAVVVPTVVFPPIGFAMALASILAALSNYRQADRLALAIDLKNPT
jgi:hypothetical protein